jgi:hypothetical protein
MNIDLIISQLRTYATVFGGRVAGSAELATVQSQTWMAYPAAYVVPKGSDAEPNDYGNGLLQLVKESFVVVVVLDNSIAAATGDRRGQTAYSTVETVEASIFGAILNWRMDPVSSNQSVFFVGMDVADMDAARLFVEFSFANIRTITADDGYLPTYDDLTEINIQNTDGADPAFEIDLTGLNT